MDFMVVSISFAVVIGFYAIIGGSHVVGAGFNDGLTDVLLGSVAGDAVGGPGAHVSLVGAEDALGSALDGVAGEAASTAGKQRASGGDQVVGRAVVGLGGSRGR